MKKSELIKLIKPLEWEYEVFGEIKGNKVIAQANIPFGNFSIAILGKEYVIYYQREVMLFYSESLEEIQNFAKDFFNKEILKFLKYFNLED